MPDFEKYVCWNPVDVEPVLSPVVEAASDAAFLATHRSLPILPEISQTYGRQQAVSEAGVLGEFLSFQRDPAIMAVVGPPGSGKSHLVKWLHAQLASDPERLVLYVPREDTSLRVVLNRILGDLPGEEAARLRADVRSATDKVIPELAAANVLALIANELEFNSPTVKDLADAPRKATLLGHRDGPRMGGLPELLRHPAFRALLLSSEGVIAKNVGIALNEYTPDDGSPPRFSAADLRFGDLDKTAGLPAGALDVLNLLRSERPESDEWRRLALFLLDACLGTAIGALLGLQSKASLAEVMKQAREILHRENRELILLIEDLALFDRIGAALIDALVIPSSADRCKMRTAFAITDDPYDRLPETLQSRVGLRFRTGLPLGTESGDVDSTRLIDFVGSYLNAVRVGPAGLEQAFSAADKEERASGTWVPNACGPCDFRVPCHASEGFGESRDHFGLYPLNATAAERLIKAALITGRFLPRKLLTDVVSPLLTNDAADLADGVFPSRAFESRAVSLPNGRDIPAVAAEVLQDLQDRRDAHRERRARVLRFWRPGYTRQATDVSSIVHKAFALPVLGETVEDEAEAITTTTTTSVVPPPPVNPNFAVIDRWLSDDEEGLPTDLSGLLRRRLHELVVGRIDWNDELLSPELPEIVESGEVFSPESFKIEAAAPGRRPKPTAVVFELPRVPDTAVVLKAVLRLEEAARFDSGREYWALQSRLQDWAEKVLARLRESGDTSAFPVLEAAQYLVVTTLALGAEPEAYTDPVVAITEAFAGLSSSALPTTAAPSWGDFLRKLLDANPEQLRSQTLARAQAAQGSGKPQAVDAPRFLDVLTVLLKQAEADLSEPPRSAPLDLRDLGARLRRDLRDAHAAEVEALTALHDQVDWDTVANLASIVELVLHAMETAAAAGLSDIGAGLTTFRSRCSRVAALPAEHLAVLQTCQADLQSQDWSVRLRASVLARPAVPVARELIAWLQEAEDHLATALRNFEYEMSRAFPDTTPAEAEQSLLEALEDAEQALVALAGVGLSG